MIPGRRHLRHPGIAWSQAPGLTIRPCS